jgi:hypothetical protein
MSNYTLAVSWSGKDALSDSDAAKVISGADFNTEFTTVQTAINSKSNLNGDAGEAFSTSTAGSSSNTTIAASTQYVTSAISGMDTKANILSAVYPVGSIFTTVTAYANSAAVVAVIGGTTWVAFGAGRVLVGLNSGDSDFNTVEEEGGRKDAVLKAHTHTEEGTYATGDDATSVGGGVEEYFGTSQNTGSTGDSLTGNENLQPYVVVYMWKRTA